MNGVATSVMKEAAKTRQDTAKSLQASVESMDFAACTVPHAGPFHKNLGVGVALLLQSDSERITQAVAEMEARPPVVCAPDGSEIVVDRKAKTVTVKGMVTWLFGSGLVAAVLIYAVMTFGGTWFSRSNALQEKGQVRSSRAQDANAQDNVEIKKMLRSIEARLDADDTIKEHKQ